jgi:hypothetical protein
VSSHWRSGSVVEAGSIVEPPWFLRRLDLSARAAMRRLDVRVDDGFGDGLGDLHQLAEATARHDRWRRR